MEHRVKKVRKKANLKNITPKEVILKKLGEHLRNARRENGFTSFEHFAFQMDIGRSLYAKYEAGGDMKVSTLFRILQGMGMKVSDFFKEFD